MHSSRGHQVAAREQILSGPQTRKKVKTVNIIRSNVVIFHFDSWFSKTSAMIMALEQFSGYKCNPSKILTVHPCQHTYIKSIRVKLFFSMIFEKVIFEYNH